MNDEWQYQIRVYLAGDAAGIARRDPGNQVLGPLTGILARHKATMKCQFDAFADYVAAAERQGIERYPLYHWTKATIEDPAKKAKYLESFTLYVNDQEVYPRAAADALEADLLPLVGGPLITRLTRHDTNPANNPQPPARSRN